MGNSSGCPGERMKMRIVKDVLKQNTIAIVLWIVFAGTIFSVFSLYNLPLEPVVYSAVLSLIILVVCLAVLYLKGKRAAAERENAIASIAVSWRKLPNPQSALEEDYGAMLRNLGEMLEKTGNEYEEERQDILDYYTAWVHQIKTPIAVMKLKLSDDTPENFALKAELFRIEQYVDMVLQYIRLGSKTTDLLVKQYQLDDLIKETIRKYAPQFVEKRVKLDFTPTETNIVTDKKWFVLILEQFISNAIKYTPSGTVSIRAQDGALVVADTGIGIAPEDLPRIFEKGFTGNNGRIGEKSSGLGLYLVKKAADLLKIDISVDSTLGKGTEFKISLNQGVDV